MLKTMLPLQPTQKGSNVIKKKKISGTASPPRLGSSKNDGGEVQSWNLIYFCWLVRNNTCNEYNIESYHHQLTPARARAHSREPQFVYVIYLYSVLIIVELKSTIKTYIFLLLYNSFFYFVIKIFSIQTDFHAESTYPTNEDRYISHCSERTLLPLNNSNPPSTHIHTYVKKLTMEKMNYSDIKPMVVVVRF